MNTARLCPVCHAGPAQARPFLEKNIDTTKLSGFSFSSRKEPEYMCHRLVLCTACDLIYADHPPDQTELAHAYHLADYDSAEEANDAAAAYISAIRPTLSALGRRQRALEIGTGTGVFLDYLAREGFSDLVGVEPSAAAIAVAPGHRRAWIREGIFDEKNFSPASYDLICCFMTMEHVRDPDAIAQAAFRLLRKGGAFVTVTHDYRGIVNRMMGRRSPIIDIEHLQLFSERSVRRLFESTGYLDIQSSAFINTYALRYWARLLPLPRALKSAVKGILVKLDIDDKKVGVNVGNLITAGFKRV